MKYQKLCFIFSIVLVLFWSQTVLAVPYWAGKGAVIEYVAYRDEAYINGMIQKGLPPETVTTANLYYLYNGFEYTIKAYNTSYLMFEIIGDSPKYFKVRVVFLLSNVTILTNAISPKFWDAKELINHSCRRDTCLYRLKTLRITGTYEILKKNDTVIKNGRVYGKTFLWIDPLNPPRNGTVLFEADGITLRVQRIENVNEYFKTYNGTFGPPLVELYTTKINIHVGNVSAEGMNVYLYDGSDFVLLSWFGLAGIADLRAIGVVTISLMDQRAGMVRIHTLGPTLYRFTPAPKTPRDLEEQSPQLPRSRDEGYGKILFYGILVIIAGVLVFGLVLRLKR